MGDYEGSSVEWGPTEAHEALDETFIILTSTAVFVFADDQVSRALRAMLLANLSIRSIHIYVCVTLSFTFHILLVPFPTESCIRTHPRCPNFASFVYLGPPSDRALPHVLDERWRRPQLRDWRRRPKSL